MPPSPKAGLWNNVLFQHLLLAGAATVIYLTIARSVYWIWLNNPMRGVENELCTMTWWICIFFAYMISMLQKSSTRPVMILTLIGLIFGSLIPNHSESIEHMNFRIRSSIFQFRPFYYCLGALVGTVVGQNHVRIRKIIAYVNNSSFIIFTMPGDK